MTLKVGAHGRHLRRYRRWVCTGHVRGDADDDGEAGPEGIWGGQGGGVRPVVNTDDAGEVGAGLEGIGGR